MFRPKSDKPDFKLRRTPPPNYQQRSTKVKVFALVALLMGVLWAAERSRDPNSWDWFWRLEQKPEETRNRLEPKLSRGTHDAPGTIVQSNEPADETVEEDASEPPAEPTELAWRQGWKDIYAQLDPTERTLLFEILAQGRGEHRLGPAALDQASQLVLKLNDSWNSYGEAARQSLADLKPDDRESWQTILREVNDRWSTRTRPPLEAAAQGVAVPSEQVAGLRRFQETLDRLALNLVRDDSPLRPDESDIWFRLMSLAARTPAADLRKQALRGVTYLQMFKQSNHYRGDLIRIDGIVRGGWKARAVNNPWGLEHYYVLWIHPTDGPNAPIVVHARTLPEGFPEIKERAEDGQHAKLHEDVVLDGFFLKRQAYLGADGTYTAPLMIAKSVHWRPELSSESRRSQRWEPTLSSWPWIVAGTLGFSLLVVGIVYWRLREQEQYHASAEAIAQADMSLLQGVEIRPSIEDGLKQLERTYTPKRPS